MKSEKNSDASNINLSTSADDLFEYLIIMMNALNSNARQKEWEEEEDMGDQREEV